MENFTNKQELITPHLEDVHALGRLLSKQRNTVVNKTYKQVALELDVTHGVVSKWENDGVLPDEGKLPLIAKVYQIDVDELKKIFSAAKLARETEKKNREDLNLNKHKKIDNEQDFGTAKSGRVNPKHPLDDKFDRF